MSTTDQESLFYEELYKVSESYFWNKNNIQETVKKYEEYLEINIK
jgi:hypothetical protein